MNMTTQAGLPVRQAGYHKGASRGDIATPREFIHAVEARYGRGFDLDLAADEFNAVAPVWYDIDDDSLLADWAGLGRKTTCWCNPPYGNIAPWVKKAAETRRGRRPWIAMLLPAAGRKTPTPEISFWPSMAERHAPLRCGIGAPTGH